MKKLLLLTLISFISFTLLSQSCLPEGITFTTQEQIDNFQTDNPGCTEIEGGVIIGGSVWGNDITNLNGLHNVTSIGGLTLSFLQITDLFGLENLISINDSFIIFATPNLMNLGGLENLTYIGGSMQIGFVNFASNITNLDALLNLTSINGSLTIIWNPNLTSLSGLDNIVAASIDNISIRENVSLATCEVQSICNYLSSPNGTITILDNATGCNSQEEVEEACAIVAINEVSIEDNITTSPNPFTTSTTLSYELQQPEKVLLTIYNHLGQNVYQTQENQPQGKQQLIWNAERHAGGIYCYRMQAGDEVANGKLVKVR